MCLTPGWTGRLTVGRNITLNLTFENNKRTRPSAAVRKRRRKWHTSLGWVGNVWLLVLSDPTRHRLDCKSVLSSERAPYRENKVIVKRKEKSKSGYGPQRGARYQDEPVDWPSAARRINQPTNQPTELFIIVFFLVQEELEARWEQNHTGFRRRNDLRIGKHLEKKVVVRSER
jgi:hypothetical protein